MDHERMRRISAQFEQTRLNRRRFLKLGVAGAGLVALPLLAACGDDDEASEDSGDDASASGADATSDDASSSDTESTSDESSEATTVVFEGWDYEPPLVEENIGNFEDLNPDVAVEYTAINGDQYRQKINAEFMGGVEPDALYVRDDYFAGWVTAGYLQDLEGMPGLDEVYDRLYEYNATAMTYDGKRYGLPYYTDCETFVYNTEMLEKAGLSAPPKSLDEIIEQGKQIKEAGIVEYPIGFGFKLTNDFWTQWWALIYGSGAQLFDDDMKPIMDQEGSIAKEVLIWIVRGLKEGVIDPASIELTDDQSRDTFMAGQYAFTMTSRYDVELVNSPDSSQVAGKAEIALIPSLDGESKGTVGWNRQYCITKNTDVKDAAYDLIYYLGGLVDGEPYTAKFWFLKRGLGFAYKGLGEDPEIRAKLEEFVDPDIYFKQAELARPREAVNEPWYSEWESANQQTLQQVFTDQMTPDDAMKKMAADAIQLEERLG